MKTHCLYDALVPITELRAHPKNRNAHPQGQIERLAKILEYQGFRYPIKVSKRSNCITSGHGRLEAAKLNGWTHVPVNYQDYESDEQEYADVQADNSIASWAELDLSGINADIGDLGPDFDIDLLGLKDFVLEPADKLEPQCDEDEVPEHVEPKTKLGDIYKLGRHRLMCGDSTSIDAVEMLMDGKKANVVFTSPPYNANTRFSGIKNSGELYNSYSDDKTSEEYISFTREVLGNCFSILDGFIFWNVNYNSNSKSEFIKQILPYLDQLVETICWKKTALPVPHGLTRNWEPIFVFSSFDKKIRLGKANVTEFNFWEISNLGALDKSHRAAFPVALPEKGISLYDDSVNVFDPFCGSGSTLIACEKLGKSGFGMELDPHYCDVIVARWEKYTGKKAELLTPSGVDKSA